MLESPTFPGTTEEVVQPRLESAGLVIGTGVLLAFSPERVDPEATASSPARHHAGHPVQQAVQHINAGFGPR